MRQNENQVYNAEDREARMKQQKIVTQEEWTQARIELLKKEKEFNKKRDELTKQRQEMPWVKVDKNYTFQDADGEINLQNLFGECSQLIVYHFMYHPSWEQPCKSCSFWADNLEGIDAHLRARDANLVVVAKATIKQINEYKKRMGWSFKWVSSHDNDFNQDLGVGFNQDQKEKNQVRYNYKNQPFAVEELPGVSVFAKDESGEVFHTYSTYSRGIDMLNGAYHFLDILPKGRDEDNLSPKMEWVRRHDEYEAG